MKVVSLLFLFYEKKTNKKCACCSSNYVQKWGKQSGNQRFRCSDCGYCFVVKNEEVSLNNQFVWFKKWVMERQVYKHLIRDSGMSQSKLQSLFKTYLSSAPTVAIKSKENVHLLIDGTYFSNGLCLILYYDHDIRYVQLYRHTDREKYKEIKEDLENLKQLNVAVYSVTCDGHKAILKAVKKAYPNAIIQRCLVHIKRQVKTYTSEQPKLSQAKELLKISNQITAIKTQEQCSLWLLQFYNWYHQNEPFINEQSKNIETGRMWFTHKKLHTACSLIINALPNMFCYLNDEQIPYTTNRLESYFTHLKEKLILHRGLKFESRKSFIKWYLHFKNKDSN